jgi:tRNA (adenine37-N6)-methyltransferase
VNEAWRETVGISPIGVVESAFTDFSQPAPYDSDSVVVLREEPAEELNGIEHFSHLHVLYRQHRREEWRHEMSLAHSDEQAVCEPSAGLLRGLFASRSPKRPSGIGSCVVRLLRREGTRLFVRGLDAFDGSPVLDIKIYIPRYDSIPMAEAPLHWSVRHGIDTTSRLLHWDTMNVALALGLRAGKRALEELALDRGEAQSAVVCGGPFFAQGIEAVTGCSVLRNTMSFAETATSVADWSLCLSNGARRVDIRLTERRYPAAAAVLDAPDAMLFATVEMQTTP